jgi:alpha-ribazole phosphatase
MRLYLVRHPKPLVASGICYGRTDVAVSPQERALTLQDLKTTLPQNVPVYSSPLARCRELATDLAAALEYGEPILDPRLAEMDFGTWEMRAWDTIPRSDVDAWTNDLSGYRPGGGESVLEVTRRVHAFHGDLLRAGHAAAIVICHAGTIRLLLACQRALPLVDTALYAARTPHKIGYGEVLVLDCYSVISGTHGCR